MKKAFKELVGKTVKDLTQEMNGLKDEIMKLELDMRVNKPKNTNQLTPKKKRIAQIATALTVKLAEAVQK